MYNLNRIIMIVFNYIHAYARSYTLVLSNASNSLIWRNRLNSTQLNVSNCFFRGLVSLVKLEFYFEFWIVLGSG